MALMPLSISTANHNITKKLRSSCKELKQQVLAKQNWAVIRHAKREPAEKDEELFSETKKTRMEVEDPITATYLAKIRQYKTCGRWAADRRKFGRDPYDDVLGF